MASMPSTSALGSIRQRAWGRCFSASQLRCIHVLSAVSFGAT